MLHYWTEVGKVQAMSLEKEQSRQKHAVAKAGETKKR